MPLKIRVGRSEYFLFFEIILFTWSTFHKNRTVSRLVAPSFSFANSLISADLLFAARERYKNKSFPSF